MIVPRSKNKNSKFYLRKPIKEGKIAKIPLGVGGKHGYAIVDVNDLPKVEKMNWSFTHGYAVNGINGKRTYMHRVIASASTGDVVDHINRNRLDNRKENIRITNKTNNAINKVYKNKYGYRGVTRDRSGKYTASISYKNIKYNLGAYDTPELAARAYNQKAKILHREFAVLNEIPNEKNT